MALVSFFKAKCRWCDDEFEIRTGSGIECNRCRTLMTLMAPLSIHEIETLLNACSEAGVARHGRWQIAWLPSEDTDLGR